VIEIDDFVSWFGRHPTAFASAPGRVNLIGEHTDYNGGFVLPTLIPQRTRVLLAVRSDDQIRAVSGSLEGVVREYRLGQEKPGQGWLDFVQGVTHLLRCAGLSIQGFEILIESDVPVGSGLSSSAALDVSLMRALREAFSLNLDGVGIARLGQRVENEFVGAQVGIMDPMACSLGQPGHALFLDTRSLHYEHVPLPADADLVVINSGVVHDHSAGDYNTRRAECEEACRLLGIAQLRDLTASDLGRLDALPEVLRRRARHVVTEDERVLATVEALHRGDLAEIGRLFFASHDSLRDDYQVSIPEIDRMVDLARADGDVYGARLTGGGFGGSVVMLTRVRSGRAVAERTARSYEQETGRSPTVLVPANDECPAES
jgi:galactokinase